MVQTGKEIPPRIRPFMIVQLGRKTFDQHSQSRYFREIENLGFSKEEIVQALKD